MALRTKRKFRRAGIFLGSVAVFLFVLFLLRFPILKGIGSYLVKVDSVEHVDAIYVLGGAPFSRGDYAAELYHKGVAEHIICTGEEISYLLQVKDINESYASLTRSMMLKSGVDSSAVELLEVGTSTWEESEAIVDHAQSNGYKRIAILSSEFHTRRVNYVFRRKMRKAGIELRIFGAKEDEYKPKGWWKEEMGLITLNNEYLKLIHYRLKY